MHWARCAAQFKDDSGNSESSSCWFINASSKPDLLSREHNNLHNPDDAAVVPPIVIDYDTDRREIVNIQGLEDGDMYERKIPPFFRDKPKA